MQRRFNRRCPQRSSGFPRFRRGSAGFLPVAGAGPAARPGGGCRGAGRAGGGRGGRARVGFWRRIGVGAVVRVTCRGGAGGRGLACCRRRGPGPDHGDVQCRIAGPDVPETAVCRPRVAVGLPPAPTANRRQLPCTAARRRLSSVARFLSPWPIGLDACGRPGCCSEPSRAASRRFRRRFGRRAPRSSAAAVNRRPPWSPVERSRP